MIVILLKKQQYATYVLQAQFWVFVITLTYAPRTWEKNFQCTNTSISSVLWSMLIFKNLQVALIINQINYCSPISSNFLWHTITQNKILYKSFTNSNYLLLLKDKFTPYSKKVTVIIMNIRTVIRVTGQYMFWNIIVIFDWESN